MERESIQTLAFQLLKSAFKFKALGVIAQVKERLRLQSAVMTKGERAAVKG